ncbi:MAG: DNA sulfur modification protein DndB [Opitutus sp.]|nr:DNA sulfur modification protein DndB [Opitutus sp.]
MKVKFPAMQATLGQRTYYACVMKLTAIPKMFTFTDWIEFTPEDREQRVLNKKRIPDIARYILDNEDGYLFSSITASYKCKVHFEPVGPDGLGFLEMDFEEANFVINDGQHRCAAIAAAVRENPALGDESISVLLFPYESKARVQQMFTDLNKEVVKTSKSLNILFDQRDTLAKVTLEVCEKVTAFHGLVDKDNVSLPARSEKMFTLAALYDATEELLAGKRTSDDAFINELVTTSVDYWTTVSTFMPDWRKVRNREIRPIELRQENISSHSVVLRALGGMGAELTRQFPADWKTRLAALALINWNKTNRDWENVCMVANSVISNRQARLATKAYVKLKLGLLLSESEQRSIAHLTARNDFAPGVSGGAVTTATVNDHQDVSIPPMPLSDVHTPAPTPVPAPAVSQIPVPVTQHGQKLRKLPVEVTQGMIRQNLLTLTEHVNGGRIRVGEDLIVEAQPSGERFRTDVVDSGNRLRERGAIGRFYREAGVHDGEFVVLTETAPQRWTLRKAAPGEYLRRREILASF